MPLTAHMLATHEARHRAARADTWAVPPARAAQHLAGVRGVAQRWPEWHGPRHAWVMRCWKTKNKRPDPSVLVTPDPELSASWSVRPDEERPAMAPNDEQRTRGGWQRQPLRATSESASVLYVLTVVLRSRL